MQFSCLYSSLSCQYILFISQLWLIKTAVVKCNTCCSLCFLFRLYRSLEDYDVVRSIFGGKVGTKSITCAALQAEANSDFAEAVKLYNEVYKSWVSPIKSRDQWLIPDTLL